MTDVTYRNVLLLDDNENGLIPYIPPATNTSLGIIKVGSGLSIATDGTLESTYSLPIADIDTLGGVIPSTGLAIDEEGYLSLDDEHGYLIYYWQSGPTWYRQYSDGFIMQGGYVSTEALEVAWSQPAISSAGTLGGDSFAVAAEAYSSSYQIVNAFNDLRGYISGTDKKSWLVARSHLPIPLILYFPTAVKISKIIMVNRYDGNYAFTSGNIKASNTDSNYQTIVESWSNSVTEKNTAWDIIVDSEAFYHYYQINFLAASSGSGNPGAVCILIEGTYQTSGGTSVTFPIPFTSTNYSYILGFQGSVARDLYVSSKTISGFTLSNTSNAIVSYVCMGY